MNGKIDIVEACLKHGGEINRTTECHGSLLHAVDISSDGYFQVLEYLLKNGNDSTFIFISSSTFIFRTLQELVDPWFTLLYQILNHPLNV